jgi:putative SOS response-associated peptidase YedK
MNVHRVRKETAVVYYTEGNEPIFMVRLTNFRPYTHRTVDVSFVIVTEDSGAGMVDVHDRPQGVLKSEDALR